MNPVFASHIEQVPKLFALLKEATAFVEKGLIAHSKRAGIYAFFENGAPQYVGRTRNLQQRLRGHISANHYTATFAFKMARRMLGLPATYNKVGARAQRVKAMQVRFVEIKDPVHQYLVELYAHLEYALPLDEFDTH